MNPYTIEYAPYHLRGAKDKDLRTAASYFSKAKTGTL